MVKVLVSIGTRPEAVKLAPLVHELAGRSGVTVRVLATAQHRERPTKKEERWLVSEEIHRSYLLHRYFFGFCDTTLALITLPWRATQSSISLPSGVDWLRMNSCISFSPVICSR